MNEDRAVEILRIFQQKVNDANEQRNHFFNVNLDQVREALLVLKTSYSDISVHFENIEVILSRANIQASLNNEVIFNVASFSELNEKLIEMFRYL